MILSVSFLRKYSSYITLFALLVAMSSLVWFGIIPLKQSLNDRMRSIQEFYAGQENRQKQVTRLPELKDQYTVIMENEAKLHILITEDQIVDFIKTLEGLANTTNVQMTITSKDNGQIIEPKKTPLKVTPPKTGESDAAADTSSVKPKVTSIMDDVPFERYLRLSIKAEGQYTNIVAFLRKIETLPTGLDVIGVEIKKIDTVEQKDTAPKTTGNPFTLLGDGSVVPQQAPQVTATNTLEATFDVLVYVDKKN